jgi:hypothetical protein
VAPIPSRWHNGAAPLRPYNTPGKQAALVFALYGLRKQMAGDVPGETEATLTITARTASSSGAGSSTSTTSSACPGPSPA